MFVIRFCDIVRKKNKARFSQNNKGRFRQKEREGKKNVKKLRCMFSDYY